MNNEELMSKEEMIKGIDASIAKCSSLKDWKLLALQLAYIVKNIVAKTTT